MIDNYYKDILNLIKNLILLFMMLIINKIKIKILSNPKEIMNKILSISYALNPENSLLHQQIQEILLKRLV